MIHRGEIVERAVRQSGMTITEVAKRMNKSRRHLYNIFEDPNVSIDVILQIGKIIYHDFTQDLPELKKEVGTLEINEPETPYNDTKSAIYWKDKYLELLERYNSLLEKVNV